MAIVIRPPFWQTWWFRGSMSTVVLALILGLYKMRVQSIDARRKELESQVREKTAELSRQTLEAQLLHRTAELGAEVQSMDEALQGVVDLVCDMTKWPVGHVYEPSPTQTDELIPTTIWYLADLKTFAVFKEVTERTTFMRGEGLPGRILESSEPEWIVNVQEDTNFPRNRLAADLGVKGAFGFPVKSLVLKRKK